MNEVEPIRDIDVLNDIGDYLRKDSERNYVMLWMGVYTGLRISDILKLRVRDVKDKKEICVTEQKTGKTRRIPLNKDLQGILEDYTKGKYNFEYLFPSRKKRKNTELNERSWGLPIRRQQAYRILNEAGRKFGLERVGSHTLRKTFGYHHYMMFKDAEMLRDILGHSNIRETLRYIGMTKDTEDSSIMRMSLLRSGKGSKNND